jgi:hypothetical protein
MAEGHMLRVGIAVCADVLVISMCAFVRSIAHAGDNGLLPQIGAGLATYFGVWLLLYRADARRAVPDANQTAAHRALRPAQSDDQERRA